MLKIVVLISGAGSNLAALLAAIESSRATDAPIDAEVVAIGADVDCEGLALADERGIPSFIERPRDHADRAAWGDALLERVRAVEPDLTILSGFMRLVPPRFVDALSPALLNTHPAYLPEFPGAHAVRDAMAAGVSQTGASLIVVDTGVDTGPIVDRVRVPIAADDTEETVHARIKIEERRLLAEAVRGVADGTVDLARIAETRPVHPEDSTTPTPTDPVTAEEHPAA